MAVKKDKKPRKADRRKEERRWFDGILGFFRKNPDKTDRRKSDRRAGERRKKKN